MESNGSESLKDTHIKDQTNTEHHTDADQRDIEGDTDTNGTDRKSYVPPGPEPILRVEKSTNEGHRCTYLCRLFSRYVCREVGNINKVKKILGNTKF